MSGQKLGAGLLFGTACLFALPLQASTVTYDNSANGPAVYEKVNVFENTVHFTDTFEIGAAGTYQATLTDFAFPNPFTDSGLNITTATDSLATLTAPGQVTFEADPGDYYLSLFAVVGGSYAQEQMQQLFDEEKNARREKWLSGLSDDEISASKQKWKALSDEERQAHQERTDGQIRDAVEGKYCRTSMFGQYGIEVVYLGDGPIDGDGGETAVPVPATVWLMGSGILGVVGIGRRNRNGRLCRASRKSGSFFRRSREL